MSFTSIMTWQLLGVTMLSHMICIFSVLDTACVQFHSNVPSHEGLYVGQ